VHSCDNNDSNASNPNGKTPDLEISILLYLCKTIYSYNNIKLANKIGVFKKECFS